MNDFFRCQCKKIVCQVVEDTIIIKCRHCKRYVHINTKGINSIQFKLTADTGKGEPQIIEFDECDK
ncbi:hypothetical protein MFMK1_002260 [Metallumcola ferriviriculae]|uniref:Uncharacterized protein n=1 Tax=Metallumcola ferriviriculae TaxID=3039180 RepID=A0AAU0UQE1_9FIRM|nr:hypothetical protein MFMK1_002260 [Desulfitibacteraceae bacterium MK1]